MRVFLCQSYLGPASSAPPLVFPIGLAYLASMIRDDHEVYCWDPNVAQDPVKELPRLLEKTTPDVVGISLRNVDSSFSFAIRWYYPQFVSMIRTIKETVPSCKLVAGGCGFSLFAEEIMKRNPQIDFGIISEGEHSFAQLLKNLDNPERVNNLIFKRNGQIWYTERRREEFEFSLPPARDLFNIQEYKKKPYTMGVQTKRGCGFNCIYCPSKFLAGSRYRLRSPKKVVDEIEQLLNTYDLNSYFFVDSTFNHPYEHSRRICQELIKRKLKASWSTEFATAFMNEGFMREAVEAGCRLFYFSPDGASDRALDFLGKNTRFGHIEKTISLARSVEGANVGYNFVYDLPRYNSEHVAGLARLIPRMIIELREKLYLVSLTKIRVYPRTQLHDISIQEGKISQGASILYPVYYSAASRLSVENIIPELLRRLCSYFDIVTKKCKAYDF
jgi:anaerobic magnesium-protoporphyrin IX monomethyl ester cyclase